MASSNNKPRILRRLNSLKTVNPDQINSNQLPSPILKNLPCLQSFHSENINLTSKQKPPYSYMAMIEMAINSSNNNRMSLRDIYSWIEQKFDYFSTAKPGWKNSIRHNLSLHDIFVRESDEKNSTWSLKIDENRTPLTFETVLARENRVIGGKRKMTSNNPLQDITKSAKNLNNKFVSNFCTPVKRGNDQFSSFSDSKSTSSGVPFQKPALPNPKNTYAVPQKFNTFQTSPIPTPHPRTPIPNCQKSQNCIYHSPAPPTNIPTIIQPNTSQTKFIFYPVQINSNNQSSTPKTSGSLPKNLFLKNKHSDANSSVNSNVNSGANSSTNLSVNASSSSNFSRTTDSGIESRSPLVMVCRQNNGESEDAANFVKNFIRTRKSKVELLNDSSVGNGLLDTSGSDTCSSNSSPSKISPDKHKINKTINLINMNSPPKNSKTATKLETNSEFSPIRVHSSWTSTPRVKFENFDSEFQLPVSSEIEQASNPFQSVENNRNNNTEELDPEDIIFDAQDELEISKMLETYDLNLLQLEDLDKI